MNGNDVVRASGVVLIRGEGRSWQTLLLHRPHRRDWSLPKGKIDPGEHVLDAAVRECDEETGIRPILGMPLGRQTYTAMGRPKVVDYWLARVGVDNGFTPDDEVADLRWVGLEEARRLLTYRRDVDFVVEAYRTPPTAPLIVLRHAAAVRREDFDGEELQRPLTGKGRSQSRALISLLAAYGITEVHTSDAARCIQTVQPYLSATRVTAEHEPGFSETGHEARPEITARRMADLTAAPAPITVCSHRPVLPTMFETLASFATGRPRDMLRSLVGRTLPPGGFVVVHRAFVGPGGTPDIMAVEVSQPRKGEHEIRIR